MENEVFEGGRGVGWGIIGHTTTVGQGLTKPGETFFLSELKNEG